MFKGKFPVWVDKDTRDGGTLSLTAQSLKDGDRVILVTPYKNIAEEKLEELSEFNGFFFGVNDEFCLKTIESDMPFTTKGNCNKCKHYKNLSCLYSQALCSMKEKEHQLIVITPQKMLTLCMNKETQKIIKGFADYYVLDECQKILKMEYQTYKHEQIRRTGIKQVDDVIRRVQKGDPGDEIKIGKHYMKEFYKIYKQAERHRKPRWVGEMIAFFNTDTFLIQKKGVVAKHDIEPLLNFLKENKKKSVYVDATGFLPDFEKRLFSMRIHIWDNERVEELKNHIIVDESKVSLTDTKYRIKILEALGMNPFVITQSKEQSLQFKEFNTSYYRSKISRGIQLKDTRCLICIDLPWPPNDSLNIKQNMIEAFTQIAGRVKDPENKEYSYVFVLQNSFEDVRNCFTDAGNMCKLFKGSFTSHIEIILELIESNMNIDLEDISLVARAINSKSKPAITLTKYKHIYRKYHDFIMSEWKRRE